MAETQTKDAPATEEAPEREKLKLEVKIDAPSACQRHITVTIPHEDVERYFDNAFAELMPEAQVPGFRAGRAPRKLVEHRFRKDVKDQVKSNLLLDSMAQVSDDQKLAAISEPDIDLAAVEVPDEGPMTFEFDIEVRPEFDMPNWKGLNVERPMRDFTEKDVDSQLQRLLAQRGRLVPHEGAATAGDYIQVNITFKDGENVISKTEEQTLCIRPTLSFRDGKVEKFDKLMAGVKAGETREAKAKLSDNAPNEALRRQNNHRRVRRAGSQETRTARVDRRLPGRAGRFQIGRGITNGLARGTEAAVGISPAAAGPATNHPGAGRQRQLGFAAPICCGVKAAASWSAPCWSCAAAGSATSRFAPTKTNLRQNSLSATARALKEHFILERIAEDEKIEDEPKDYEDEIRLIADQSGESVRRVRAQLEKRGLMDILRNQIIERKTIELVLKHAKFKDVPYQARIVGDGSGRRSGRRRRGNRGSHSRGKTCRRSRAPTRTEGTRVRIRRGRLRDV